MSSHVITAGYLEGHHHQNPLRWRLGLRRKTLASVQKTAPEKMAEWTQTLLHKALNRTRESCSLPFSPKHKGKNSQGLLKIKDL